MKSKKCIKICFVSGAIARSGGTERVGSIIANVLSERGYKVYILSCWNHGEPHFYLHPNVHVEYLLDPKKEGKLYRTYFYPILKMHNFFKRNDIDIVIDIDTELSIYSSYAIMGTKSKLISWEHFNYWTMLRLKEKKRFRAKKLIRKYAEKLIVLTEQDREAHIDYLGFDPKQIVSISNPCMAISNIPYNFDSHTFLAVGRLADPKGFDMLLDSWYMIEKQIPKWKLVIVGAGDKEQELRKQLKTLKLTNVDFVGHKTDVNSYYSSAACYVLSSRYEGFPMVLLEAEAHGLPIIAFDCKTGPKELVLDRKNGYLVENGNISLLAETMLSFTKEKGNAQEMSNVSKEFVMKFNIDSIANKWETLIEEVIE